MDRTVDGFTYQGVPDGITDDQIRRRIRVDEIKSKPLPPMDFNPATGQNDGSYGSRVKEALLQELVGSVGGLKSAGQGIEQVFTDSDSIQGKALEEEIKAHNKMMAPMNETGAGGYGNMVGRSLPYVAGGELLLGGGTGLGALNAAKEARLIPSILRGGAEMGAMGFFSPQEEDTWINRGITTGIDTGLGMLGGAAAPALRHATKYVGGTTPAKALQQYAKEFMGYTRGKTSEANSALSGYLEKGYEKAHKLYNDHKFSILNSPEGKKAANVPLAGINKRLQELRDTLSGSLDYELNPELITVRKVIDRLENKGSETGGAAMSVHDLIQSGEILRRAGSKLKNPELGNFADSLVDEIPNYVQMERAHPRFKVGSQLDNQLTSLEILYPQLKDVQQQYKNLVQPFHTGELGDVFQGSKVRIGAVEEKMGSEIKGTELVKQATDLGMDKTPELLKPITGKLIHKAANKGTSGATNSLVELGGEEAIIPAKQSNWITKMAEEIPTENPNFLQSINQYISKVQPYTENPSVGRQFSNVLANILGAPGMNSAPANLVEDKKRNTIKITNFGGQ